jgi:hypothetical protein
MSLVKDLERLGDYAKNLSELVSIADAPFPDDANLGELREIARSVERLASEAGRVFANADRDRAKELTIEAAPWPSAARTTSTPRAKRTQHTSRRHIVRGIARGRELLMRAFKIDVERCDKCGARLKLRALVMTTAGIPRRGLPRVVKRRAS